MTDLAELERRIVAALARVDAGLDRLEAQAAAAVQVAPAQAEQGDRADPWASAPEPSAATETAADEAPLVVAHELPSDAAGETAEPAASDLEAEPDPRDAELEALREALAAEKAQVAALTERIRTLKGRESRNEAALQARIDQLTKQLDVQGLELHRLRKSMIQLREAVRVLREGAEGACTDAAMINKAVLAELEGLRAARSSETVELEEIIAELAALTGEEKVDA